MGVEEWDERIDEQELRPRFVAILDFLEQAEDQASDSILRVVYEALNKPDYNTYYTIHHTTSK